MMYFPQNLSVNMGSDKAPPTDHLPTHYKNIPFTMENFSKIEDKMKAELSPNSQKPYILAMSRLKHQS